MDRIVRRARARVEETLADTPIAVIQGARQVGKSTLAQEILDRRAGRYLTLDDVGQLRAAQEDPVRFVDQFQNGCLGIDEIQRAPELVLALKASVDRDRRPGRFLLTGSANLLRLPVIEDSLAGRAESVDLFGFSQGERAGFKEHFLERAFEGDPFTNVTGSLNRSDYLTVVCDGGYPEAVARTSQPRRNAWFDNYVQRILTRDAADVSNLLQLAKLPDLLRLAASHTATTVAAATIARELNMAESTLPPYLALLETLFLVQRVPAWSNNLAGRVTKAPKLALLDSGLTARLLNVAAVGLAADLNPDPAGGLVETFVLSELRKQLSFSDTAARLFHWRDRAGAEADIVLEAPDGRIVAIEVKASATLNPRDFKWLKVLRDKLGPRFIAGFVLYTGRDTIPWGAQLAGLPLSTLWISE